jgi:multicomponent Na+:H+ antiporter subunit C
MNILAAVIVGVLFGSAIFLLLCRTPVKLLIGLVLLSNAINLLIFVAAGLTRGEPPLIPEDALTISGAAADPLPQALILTAIVISFGVLAFALVLFSRTFKSLPTENGMKRTDT